MTALDFRAAAARWFRLMPVVANRARDLDCALRDRATRIANRTPQEGRKMRYRGILAHLRDLHPPRASALREVLAATEAGIRTVIV